MWRDSDAKGDIWVGTDVGLYIYHPEKDSFRHFAELSVENTKIEHTVTAISGDNKGCVWVAVESQGLFCYDLEEGKLRNYTLKNFPFISTNVQSFVFDNSGTLWIGCYDDGFSGNHYFEKRIWKEVKKGYCHFQNGDIGIAKISPCFENLKSTIFQGLPNNCGAGTTELVILRPINIYAKFYLYLFKSQWYIDEGTKYFKGVVGQQRVHKGIFTDLHIPLPPLVEQQRIVTEIEKWFALIDQIEQGKVNLQTTIKQIKSKILDLAIHGKLVPQDPNDEPSIELLQRINPDFTPCDNGHYPFDVPNEWKWCKMNDLCSFLSRGKSPKYSEDDKTYPVFAQKCNLKEGGISLEQAKFLDPSTINKWDSKYKLQTGDVLVNSTGTGTVGRTRLFDESCLGKYPFVVPDSHVSVVRTYEEINSEYVFAYMSSQLIQQYIEDNLAGSTNQKELYIRHYMD